MNFSFTAEFEKDLKNLSKKWRSLRGDINRVSPRIELLYHAESDIQLNDYRKKFFNNKRAAILISAGDREVIKMRLDVDSLGGNDKVRIVFIAIRSQDEIKFIELYAKNEKDREDQARIKRYLN